MIKPGRHRSQLEAMLQLRCPRCRQGKMFKYGAYNLSKFDEMYKQCTECGLFFEIELGFYWGAMYISYGFSVALVVLVGLVLYIAGDPPIWVYIITVAGSALLLTPLFFRYARMLMLYFFGSVKYQPEADNRNDSEKI